MIQCNTTAINGQDNLKAIKSQYQLNSNHIDHQEGYAHKLNCQEINYVFGGSIILDSRILKPVLTLTGEGNN